MEFYCSVFPDSRILSIERYPDESLDNHFEGTSGKVLTGRFVLDGTEFICLDGGPVFTFNEAISLTIECADQAEIDHYWSHLSAAASSQDTFKARSRAGERALIDQQRVSLTRPRGSGWAQTGRWPLPGRAATSR
nr:VOC family protein [Brevibacterium siliguriense]